MRRLALAAAIAAVGLWVPIPLTAQTGGGATALIPMSEVPTGQSGNGAVEAPPVRVPEPPPTPPVETPAEEPPQLMSPEEMAAAAPPPEPEPAPVAAAAVEPEPAPAVPAQETVEEPPTQEPTDGPVTPPSDRDRNGTDPEEFEEDLGDPGAGGEQGTSGPSPTSIPAAARLPQTGTNVAPPAAAGLLLLLAGMSLRRVRPARR